MSYIYMYFLYLFSIICLSLFQYYCEFFLLLFVHMYAHLTILLSIYH